MFNTMTHGPFGLSPQVLSIGFLVVFLGGGTLLSLLMSRGRNTRVVAIRRPTQQAGQFPPPVYPSMPQPAYPYGELIGLWNIKSAARWVGVVVGAVMTLRDESSLVRSHSGRLSLNPGRRLWILADGSNRLPKLNSRVRFPSSGPHELAMGSHQVVRVR